MDRGEAPCPSVLMCVSPSPLRIHTGEMPSGDALSGLGIGTFERAGPSLPASGDPPSTSPDPSSETVTGPATPKEMPTQPFIIGEGLLAIPVKLVA